MKAAQGLEHWKEEKHDGFELSAKSTAVSNLMNMTTTTDGCCCSYDHDYYFFFHSFPLHQLVLLPQNPKLNPTSPRITQYSDV